MLSKILSKETCAGCKFCCSFRRCSLWETPLFPEDTVKRLGGRFNMEQMDGRIYGRMDFSGKYATDNPEEEAACEYLDLNKGCTLSYEDKPFDCKIWPLRIMRTRVYDERGGGAIANGEKAEHGIGTIAEGEAREHAAGAIAEGESGETATGTIAENRYEIGGKLVVALTPTCPAINKVDIEEVKKLVEDGLGNTIYEYAKEHPYIVKEYRNDFPILMEFEDF